MKNSSIFDKLTNRKSKQGSTLLMVLIVFLVLVIILMSASALALTNLRNGQTTRHFTSAYYVAEAGLNEYSDKLGTFLRTNAKLIDTNPDVIGKEFAKVSYDSVDENVTFNYGKVMNEDTFASITTKYNGEVDGAKMFTIVAKGIMGDVTRTLEKSFKVDMEIEDAPSGIGVTAPAIIGIDLTSIIDSGTITLNSSGSFYGPYVTNKTIQKISQGGVQSVYGPIVTSANLKLSGPLKIYNAIVIGGDFSIDSNSVGGTNIKALVLKNLNSKVVNNARWVNNVEIEYLFVPIGYNLENIYSSFQLGNGEWNIKQHIRKIIYYNPTNFDPHDTTSYSPTTIPTSREIEEIFGSTDKYDYRLYFKSDFILDNLNDPEIIERNIPTYSMPEMPVLGVTYPWITANAVESTSSVSSLISNKTLTYVGGENVIKLNQSFSVNQVNFSTDGSITLDVGNRDITIVTQSLSLNRVNFEVIGTGTLTIYVVGNNNVVTNFTMTPYSMVARNTVNGEIEKNSTRIRLIVNKVSNTVPVVTFGNNGGSEVRASIISQNLNFSIEKRYTGIIISLEGTRFDVANVGGSAFKGFAYAPNATSSISTSFIGSIIAKSVNLANTAPQPLEYDGDVTSELIKQILGYLDQEPIESGGPGGGNSEQPVTKFDIIWSSPKEVGDTR